MATIEKTAPLWFIDNLARVHVDGDEVDGHFWLVEAVGREGDMPPLHVHHTADELFYVIEGTMVVFVAGAEKIVLGPGSSALASRGIPHTYRVESPTARWLALAAPAGFEAFVREASRPAERDELPPRDGSTDPAVLVELAARYDIEILGQPGLLP